MRSEAWRPAAAACNRSPREAREAARQALRPGCEELAERIRVMPETEARPRVKNRHGGAPRGERPASWDARRLARRLVRRVMAYPTGVPPSTRTTLGAPPTLIRGERSKVANLGRGKRAAGRRKAVRMESSAVRAGRPHPEERACRKSSANSNARARVSKDEDERLGSPSCFETHRSAFGLWKRLRSRRTQVGFTRLAPLKRPISGLPEIGCDAPQHEGGSEAPTNGCTQ